jgi:hypothetical protein
MGAGELGDHGAAGGRTDAGELGARRGGRHAKRRTKRTERVLAKERMGRARAAGQPFVKVADRSPNSFRELRASTVAWRA